MLAVWAVLGQRFILESLYSDGSLSGGISYQSALSIPPEKCINVCFVHSLLCIVHQDIFTTEEAAVRPLTFNMVHPWLIWLNNNIATIFQEWWKAFNATDVFQWDHKNVFSCSQIIFSLRISPQPAVNIFWEHFWFVTVIKVNLSPSENWKFLVFSKQ